MDSQKQYCIYAKIVHFRYRLLEQIGTNWNKLEQNENGLEQENVINCRLEKV